MRISLQHKRCRVFCVAGKVFLCVAASLMTFFFIRHDISHRKGMVWSDALGLSVFRVVGCHVVLEFGSPFVIAVFMGMVTATGGGVIRDVLTNRQPMILYGQVYATAALLGSLSYSSLRYVGLTEIPAEALSCGAAFALRASAIVFDIRTGPPGEFLRIGGTESSGKQANKPGSSSNDNHETSFSNETI
jgi:uncharacterized membrane protein YeiH